MDKENDRIFQSIVENSEPIIFMVDMKGIFVLSEGKSLKALGLKPGQVVGQSAFEIYKEYPAILDGLTNGFKGNTSRDTIKVKGIKGDVYFDIFYSPIMEGEKVTHVVGMAIDVTEQFLISLELKEKIKELELANKVMIGREMDMIKLKEKLGIKDNKSKDSQTN